MTKIFSNSILLAGSIVVLTLAVSCMPCGSSRQVIQPREEYTQCLHPEVVKIRACFAECANAPDQAKEPCINGCCRRISLVQGTEKERDALRRCFKECTPDAVQKNPTRH